VGSCFLKRAIGWFGADRVIGAALSVGWRGFTVLAACQLVLFGILGLAWNVIMPRGGLLRIMTRARMVRDAAANCLPFAPMGGILAGAQSAAASGVPWPLAFGSSAADVWQFTEARRVIRQPVGMRKVEGQKS
jgi:hypothetical protein